MKRTERTSKWRIARTGIGLLLSAALASPAAAGFGEIGWNDFRVSYGDPEADDSSAAIAYSPAHDVYLVVWLEIGPDPYPRRIVARRLDGASGLSLGGEIEVLNLPDCPNSYCPSDPAVAYSPTADRFVVAVPLDDVTIGQADGEFEIFAWNVDPATGAWTWVARLSDVGPSGDPSYDALSPALACSSATTECLVAWSGDDNVDGLTEGDPEIFGQRFDAATGTPAGNDDFRISDMGGNLAGFFGGFFPAVAYNDGDDEYLVVWQGNDNVGGLVELEHEIFGQRLNAATGTAQGANDFRISDLGGTGNANFLATPPAVAYNPVNDEYLVVWAGDDDAGGLVDDEREVFAQRLDATTGAEVGDNDFRVSDMGGTGNADFDAGYSKLSYQVADHEYLVVWYGGDNVGGLSEGESEIFGQRLAAATGAEIGDNDFRLSDMGGTGQNPFGAIFPAVASNSTNGQYLVLWRGNDDVGGLQQNEIEIFGQRLGEQVLFADGFGSGNTSAWSDTVP